MTSRLTPERSAQRARALAPAFPNLASGPDSGVTRTARAVTPTTSASRTTARPPGSTDRGIPLRFNTVAGDAVETTPGHIEVLADPSASATNAAELRDAAATDETPDSDRVTRSRTASSPRSRCSAAKYSAVLDTPRAVVPFGGMIVSGAMLAAGLTLRRLRDDAEQARPTIEARLCLGLSAHEAFLPHQRSALRTALLPAIDSTKVVGLISLPGAMTGLNPRRSGPAHRPDVAGRR